MQRPRMRVAVLFLIELIAALTPLGADQGAQQMSVIVKQVPVRDKPSFTGKVIATLAYADRVTVLETRGDWLRIAFPPKALDSGWMPKSAVQAQEIVLKAGDKAVGTTASSGEVALAGKGFSEEVEAEYRKDKQLNYGAVDEMEAFRVAPETVSAFITDGGLTSEGGTP